MIYSLPSSQRLMGVFHSLHAPTFPAVFLVSCWHLSTSAPHTANVRFRDMDWEHDMLTGGPRRVDNDYAWTIFRHSHH